MQIERYVQGSRSDAEGSNGWRAPHLADSLTGACV